MWLGYFWCIVDELGLGRDVCGNIGPIGLSSDDAEPSSVKVLVDLVNGKNTTKKKRGAAAAAALLQVQESFSKFQRETASSNHGFELREAVASCTDTLNSERDFLHET